MAKQITAERVLEINRMSMSDFRKLSKAEQKRYAEYPISEERRREIMLALYRRSLN
jgi:hypothetical protein